MPSALVLQHPGPGPGLAPGPSLHQPGTPQTHRPAPPCRQAALGPLEGRLHLTSRLRGRCRNNNSVSRPSPTRRPELCGRARPVHSAAAVAQGGRRERGGGSGLRRGRGPPGRKRRGRGRTEEEAGGSARARFPPPPRRGVRAPEGGGAFSAQGGGAHARTQPRLTRLAPRAPSTNLTGGEQEE